MEKIHLASGSFMHNVFLYHWQRCPVESEMQRDGERKCIADVDGTLNMSRRYSTCAGKHTLTHTQTGECSLLLQV